MTLTGSCSCRYFFGRGESLCRHSFDCLFNFGLVASSPGFNWSQRKRCFYVHSVLSAISLFPFSAMFSSLRLCGTHRAKVFLIFNILSMWTIVPGAIPTSLPSVIEIQQRCSSSSALTAFTCTSSLADCGLPAPCFWWTSSLPLQNAYPHLATVRYGKVSLPQS